MRRVISLLSIVMLFTLLGVRLAQAQSDEVQGQAAEQAGRLRDALKYYQAALQSAAEGTSTDLRLKEKIISLVQKLSPPPAVPEEAERYMARGRAAFKAAKNPSDYEEAVTEFKRAARAAPWLAEVYYNLGVTLDKVGRYDEAIRNLKLYLLAAPNAPDTKEVRSLVFEIEYRQERAQREVREKTEEARRQEQARREAEEQTRREREERARREAEGIQALRQLAGVWRNPDTGSTYVVTLSDTQFEARGSGGWIFRGTIASSSIEGTVVIPAGEHPDPQTGCRTPSESQPWSGTISSDGNQITIKYREGKYQAQYRKGGLLFPNRCVSVELSHFEWSTFKILR